MNRWGLFVDVGWLFAAGATMVWNERVPRHDLRWEGGPLLDALVEQSETLVPGAAELLRVYWYDAAPNRRADPDQLAVANLENVKLRLGRLGRNGQKGVDGLIILDLITHAYRRILDDAVVVSGDEDLLEAIESAQSNGTRVHLLEIPIGGINDHLLSAFDRRAALSSDFFTNLLSRTESAPAPNGSGEPTDTHDRPMSTVVSGPLGPPAHRPDWMRTPLPQAGRPDPRLEDVRDRTESFTIEWTRTVDPDEIPDLLAKRPYVDASLDGALMRRLSAEMGELSEEERKLMRDVFWSCLDRWRPA